MVGGDFAERDDGGKRRLSQAPADETHPACTHPLVTVSEPDTSTGSNSRDGLSCPTCGIEKLLIDQQFQSPMRTRLEVADIPPSPRVWGLAIAIATGTAFSNAEGNR